MVGYLFADFKKPEPNLSLQEEDYLADKISWTPQVELMKDIDGEDEKITLLDRTMYLLEKMTRLQELVLTKAFSALMDTNDTEDRFWDEYKRLKADGHLSELKHVTLHSTGLSSVFTLLETDSVQRVTLTFEPDVRYWSDEKMITEINKLRAYALTLSNVDIHVNVPARIFHSVRDRFTVQAIDAGKEDREQCDDDECK